MDLSLNEDQQLIQDTFRAFFEQESSLELVRESEPLGFSEPLWERLAPTGAAGMGVSEPRGGGGAGLLEMALVAEELGRALAPVPLVEAMVAARLLERAAAPQLERFLEPHTIPTLALRPLDVAPAQLIPAGAVATHLLGLDADALVLVERPGKTPGLRNHGAAPVARWELGAGERVVLAKGDEARALFERAHDEWKCMTAAALVGLGREALRIGAEYARGRLQFGAPIGSYQGIAHPLADRATEVDGAGLLVHEAVWAFDEEPERAAALASMAFAYAAETASRTATFSLHVHGGYGFSMEYDIQLYMRRAKAWALIWDDPRAELQRVADRLWGAAGGEGR
jgi:alkylation response protein AidB-like acyl-CoA dehydrogenase